MPEYQGYSTISRYLSAWQGLLKLPEIEMLEHFVATYKRVKPAKEDIIVVNIGAGAGTSTCVFLETRPDTLVFSVDINATHDEAITNEHLRLAETGLDRDGRVIRIWGDSKIVGKRFPVPIDILLIDGDHSINGLKGDIDMWYNKVINKGLVVFHDYDFHYWPDVTGVVDKFAESGCCTRLGLAEHLIFFRKEKNFGGWSE